MGDFIKKYPNFDMTKHEDWNTNGRPLKFSQEEFEKRVNDFFEFCENENRPLTITRLACFLSCDRKTLLNYSHKDKFFPAIKKLRTYIEAQKNENLLSNKGNVIGQIFDLKNNHDWRDQQDINLHNEIIPVSIVEEKEIIDITPEKKELKGDKIEEEK